MIKLEYFGKEDFPRLIDWIDSKKLMYLFSADNFEYPLNRKQLKKYLKTKNKRIFKVIDKNTNEIIGHADFSNINLKSKSARICRVLIGNQKHRNKGFGTLVIKELIKIGFEEMKLNRIDLGVYDFNTQAIKCYKKCGFEIEGLLKENTRFENEYWSTYNMSIINNKT